MVSHARLGTHRERSAAHEPLVAGLEGICGISGSKYIVMTVMLVASLLLVAMPFVPGSFSLLVARPGTPGSVLAPRVTTKHVQTLSISRHPQGIPRAPGLNLVVRW